MKDTEHWLASPKREEFFGPLGVTNIRTFVDPQNPKRVAVLMDVPDCLARDVGHPRREVKDSRAGACRRTLLASAVNELDDERPPICSACGVTMVASELSARGDRDTDWVCLECEETAEPDQTYA